MRVPVALLSGLLLLAGFPAAATAAREATTIREQRTVTVGGVRETWQLVWVGKTTPVCAADGDDTPTCPCDGFAYGESGHLRLVRQRGGREIERMDLGPLFSAAGLMTDDHDKDMAFLQHWPRTDGDLSLVDKGGAVTPAAVERRPAVQIMVMQDYDHDGHATEFLLPLGSISCGHHAYVAIGLSPGSHRLHVLTTAARPRVPLTLDLPVWQALLKAGRPTTVTAWACGDHGSDRQTDLVVSARDGAIRVRERDLTCSENRRQKLVRESDYSWQ